MFRVYIKLIACSGTGHITYLSNNLPPAWRSHAGGRLLLRYYDLYQNPQLQFYVLLMMGAMDTQNV
jgi:hypothetical protein